ncbi:hypothetical protein HMPREF0262_01771 [Clostridium sp. ATCC 29733]|nr:hypothetical protein HMPREF0262_01771 [Clostridium sp. ATCC 29733]
MGRGANGVCPATPGMMPLCCHYTTPPGAGGRILGKDRSFPFLFLKSHRPCGIIIAVCF